MEKLFFKIVRWMLMFLVIILFLSIIGGSVYAVKLYLESQDTTVSRIDYEPNTPKVDGNDLRKKLENASKNKEAEKAKIKQYVADIIKNGSSGHEYPMGSMPPMMAQGTDAEVIATYISGEMKSTQPTSFAVCASCHGEDGNGMGGMTPSLIELPIYHGLRIKKTKETLVQKPSNSPTKPTKPKKTYLEQLVDKVALKINIYANIVEQEGVRKSNLKSFFNSQIANLPEEQIAAYAEQLIQGLDGLIDYGKELVKKKSLLDNAIRWQDYLEQFNNEFLDAWQQEIKKQQEAKNKYNKILDAKYDQALAAKVQLAIILPLLGGVTLAFILLTMMLVLFRIELNTRACIYLQSSEEESESNV